MRRINSIKRIISLSIVFLLLVSGCQAIKPAPKSEKVRKQMKELLDKVGNDAMAFDLQKLTFRNLKYDLAQAYNDEKRPDDAIEILVEIIKESKQPDKNYFGQVRNRISADYFFDSIYYKELARSYEIKQDIPSRDKALKKAEQAASMEKKLKPAEEASESRKKKLERDAILN
jgi:predicted Zn-dependent protease